MHWQEFYIDGTWRSPQKVLPFPVNDPATETAFATISLGTKADVDLAVAAAKRAFSTWSVTPKAQRLAYLQALIDIYRQRFEEMAQWISREMGAPITLARDEQAAAGLSHLQAFHHALQQMEFEQTYSTTAKDQRLHREPVGVVALITPWNWPMNQVTLKVGAALAAGCTMVLKPSELAPISSMLFAEFIDQAGIPAGVFNLVNGNGAGVGADLTAHPDIDVISFTGSTRAGIEISKAAASGIKNLSLELGGKSPNLIFADSDLEAAVTRGTVDCFENSGQSCNAPTRMLVERPVYEKAIAIAAQIAEQTRLDSPHKEGAHIGPLVSQQQFDKVQAFIQTAIDDGARLVAGGLGRPDGIEQGWFVRPTVFADVTPAMALWREEVFGPVLAITPFADEAQAISLANDSAYGLAAYIQSADSARIRRLARALRAGMIQVNGVSRAAGAPFGGYKKSGIGREGGTSGINEFLEVKTISGWQDEGSGWQDEGSGWQDEGSG